MPFGMGLGNASRSTDAPSQSTGDRKTGSVGSWGAARGPSSTSASDGASWSVDLSVIKDPELYSTPEGYLLLPFISRLPSRFSLQLQSIFTEFLTEGSIISEKYFMHEKQV